MIYNKLFILLLLGFFKKKSTIILVCFGVKLAYFLDKEI